MLGIARLAFLSVSLSLSALADASAPCWLQDASAPGRSVWLLCEEGKVLRSDDQGASWRERAVPAKEKLRAIAALDARRGFVVGDNGTVLATGDGGILWNPVVVPTNERLSAVYFVGESGWVAGWGGVVLHSADAGRTWQRQTTGITQSLEDIYFTDAEHGWAVGWVGVIIRTVDGGRSWEQVKSPAAQWTLSSVHFRDTRNGWSVGFGGQILRSRDGGVTWEALKSPFSSWLTSIQFDSASHGWITGDDGLLVSNDGGETWQAVPLEERLFLSKLTPVGGSLWAMGPFGVMKQSLPGDRVWKKVESLVPKASPPSQPAIIADPDV